jgi:hypothetical protein
MVSDEAPVEKPIDITPASRAAPRALNGTLVNVVPSNSTPEMTP